MMPLFRRCFLRGVLALCGLGGGAVWIGTVSFLAHQFKCSFERVSCPDGKVLNDFFNWQKCFWKLINNLIDAKIPTPGSGGGIACAQTSCVTFFIYYVLSVVEAKFCTQFKNGSFNINFLAFSESFLSIFSPALQEPFNLEAKNSFRCMTHRS